MDGVVEQAFVDYQNGMKYKDIAEKYGVSLSAVKSWASRYWKKGGCNQKDKKLQPKKKVATRGGQPGNKNAVGHGGTGPPGNKNAVTHGAYARIYMDALPAEEKAIYQKIPEIDSLDEEIRLMRLKVSRLAGRGKITVYDMFGNKIERDITEEEREKGMLACVGELRKLIKTKKQIELAELKAGADESGETEDDGFMEALAGTAGEDWGDEER